MRHPVAALTLCLSLITLVAGSARATNPALQWNQRFGGTLDDIGFGVAADPSGNVFMTGHFTGTANFGGADLVATGGPDIFLAKYNAAGVHQWSKRFGGLGSNVGTSVATDASGNVIVAGYFNGTANFGGSNLVSLGADDVFLAKFDAAGVHQWSQRFGSTSSDDAWSVAVDGSGNVIMMGGFIGTVSFGGANHVSSAGSTDVFVAKYNSAGVFQWSRSYGGTAGDLGQAVAVGPAGVIMLAGGFQGTANFGGSNLVSAGNLDAFLVKLDAAGTHQWSQRFGSTTTDVFYAVAVNAAGNVAVTGAFSGTVNFGGSNLVSAGNTDMVLAAYSAAGTHQWSQRFGGATSSDTGYGVAMDAVGNVLMTGYFTGTTNFGGGNQTSAGAGDIVVAKYDANGGYVWNRATGGTSGESGRGVAVDAAGNVFITGNFGGPANFGGADIATIGGNDVFLVKFDSNLPQPAISSITDIGNDQGRQVRIRFGRSGYDGVYSPSPVTQYECYRRDDDAPALNAGEMAARERAGAAREYLLANGYTQVGTVAAHGEATYGIVAPTLGDSTLALGQYFSTFYVRAATTSPTTFFDSAPDSGYSKDNLAPGVPSNFVYAAGSLSWHESSAKDFDYFTVYGSNTNSFGAATVIDYSVAPAMNVTASPYVYYYVTATDFSGNEGKPAKVNTLSGVGGTPRSYVLSLSNYPNPFNPRTTVSYTVPSRGHVTVAVYDTHGAHVATLFDGERNAGAYSLSWDGRTDDAAVAASGIYFARIEHVSGTRTKKMVLLK